MQPTRGRGRKLNTCTSKNKPASTRWRAARAQSNRSETLLRRITGCHSAP
jgi:hypothetical protein